MRSVRSATPHTALGMLVLVDVLRTFLPSLITVLGRAGSTPAELIGLYAFAWFAGAFVVAGLVRVLPPRRLALAAGVGLVAGRIVLQFTNGDSFQLYAASVALLFGLGWLVATAAAMADARPAAVGIAWGLAGATAIHATLDTVDLVWRTGPVPVVLVAIEVAAFLFTYGWTGAGEASGGWLWLAVGPALMLWGQYAGNTAHAQASAGWHPLAGALVVTAAAALATLVAKRPQWTIHPVVPALALIASAVTFGYGEVTVAGVHGVAPWWGVLGQVLGAFALAACLGWAALARPARGPARRGLACAWGLLLFLVLVFAYYAAYDLGVPNGYAPIVAALVAGGLGLTGRAATRAPVRVRGTLVGTAAALVAVATGPLWTAEAPRWQPVGDGLRVAGYNIRMGFGLAGTLTLDQQADALRGLRAHVIALSEVDRAWLLNGGHDDLRRIADRLGMRYLWAPAADEVWGDALLTSLPITYWRNVGLVKGGPTGAQALQVGVRWNGREVTVIATHLQPPADWQPDDQARQLADLVRAAPKPVVVVGDLNIEPTDPVWQVLLAAGLTDVLGAVVTSPSPGRAERIDHILATAGLTGRDPANPDLPYSDHRPVAVTLDVPSGT